MRATDIIRSVLDLLDGLDDREPKIDISIDGIPQAPEPEPEQDRFASVFKMLADRRQGEYANSPNEVVADVEDITTAVRGEPQDVRMTDPEA